MSGGFSQAIPLVLSDASDNQRTNYVAFASFTVLIWDHIDTFPDEVEYIWKGKKGIFIYLFLFNRYFTPFAFIINLYAYLSPIWTLEVLCARFVRYEGCTFALALELVGLMMLLRINALYPRHKWIVRGLASILLLEAAMIAWLLTRGEPVVHNPNSGVHACTMIFDPAISGVASASSWIPLLYDTIVFALTLYRTIPPIRREEASYIIKRLLEDGILYYSVIFSVTLVVIIMIVTAPPGTKNIAAQTEQLVTVAMMSRITIHLKRAGTNRLRDNNTTTNTITTTPNVLFFNRERPDRPSSTLFGDQTFDTSVQGTRFSVEPTQQLSSLTPIPDDVSTASNHALISKPIPDIQIV